MSWADCSSSASVFGGGCEASVVRRHAVHDDATRRLNLPVYLFFPTNQQSSGVTREDRCGHSRGSDVRVGVSAEGRDLLAAIRTWGVRGLTEVCRRTPVVDITDHSGAGARDNGA